jgi:hypothetical protein
MFCMTPIEGLTVATLIMAILSMLLSSIAIWPQLKHGLVVVRDAVLWMALIVIALAVATVSWNQYHGDPGPAADSAAAPADTVPADVVPVSLPSRPGHAREP